MKEKPASMGFAKTAGYGFALGAGGLVAYGAYAINKSDGLFMSSQEAGRHFLTQPGAAKNLREMAEQMFEQGQHAALYGLIFLALAVAALSAPTAIRAVSNSSKAKRGA